MNVIEIAVAPNNQDLRIYHLDKGATDWTLIDTLTKHDLRITGIDWAPKTNRIVTCSEVRLFSKSQLAIDTCCYTIYISCRIEMHTSGNKVPIKSGRLHKFFSE